MKTLLLCILIKVGVGLSGYYWSRNVYLVAVGGRGEVGTVLSSFAWGFGYALLISAWL